MGIETQITAGSLSRGSRGSLLRRLAGLALLLLVGLPCSTSFAVEGPQTLAAVTVRAPIAAYRGWVVWSSPVGHRWGLMEWHEGVTMKLSLASRSQPFDVDLGTTADGGVVATFSRCAHAPAYGGERLQEFEGVGCRVHVLNLATQRESEPPIPHPADTSDTTPSMWAGTIAFARSDPRHHARVAQVMLWSARNHRLRVLRHGATPAPCAFPPVGSNGHCGPSDVTGAIAGIDLDARLVAFLWKIDGNGVMGTGGGWEVRADRLNNGSSVLGGTGYEGEVCTTPGIDGSIPSMPSLAGEVLLYSQLSAACYVNSVRLQSFAVPGRALSSAAASGEVLQVIVDGHALYELVAPKPKGEVDPDCSVAEPCSIERIERPPFVAEANRLRPPFA